MPLAAAHAGDEQRGAGRWSAFWFEARFSPLWLALCRVAIAACLIELASHNARSFARHPAGARGFAEAYHLAYAAFVPALSYRTTAVVYGLAAVCGALALVGLATRFVLVAASGLLTLALLQDRLAFLNHHHHLAVVTLLLGLAPCDERLSLQAWWRRRRTAAVPPASVTSWAARLLQVTTSFVFLASALSKTKAAWWSGDLMLASQAANADVGVRGGVAWAVGLASPAVWARVALAVEYFLAFAWWSRRTRPLAYPVAAAFHLGVESAFMVGTFSFQMVAVYLIFAGERHASDAAAGGRPAWARAWAVFRSARERS